MTPASLDDLLQPLGRRIEQVAIEPAAVRAGWARLVRPILKVLGWQPTFRTEAITVLLDALAVDRCSDLHATAKEEIESKLASALQELADNVAGAERACVVNGRIPVAHAAWLRRLFEIVVHAARAAVHVSPEPSGSGGSSNAAWRLGARRVAACIDRVQLLPPLTVATAPDAPLVAGDVSANPNVGSSPPPSEHQRHCRLIELQLSALDHLMDAARAETEFLARKRRLLEAARRLLLETSAVLPLDPAGTGPRTRAITQQIMHIDRLEAAGVSPDIALLHQAKSALSRGDRQKLHAVLAALDGAALGAGDAATAGLTQRAIDRMWGGGDPLGEAARNASLVRSGGELFGGDVMSQVKRAYRSAHATLARTASKLSAEQRETYRLALDYLAPGGDRATFSALLAVDGCFDVGAALCPVRVTEIETRLRTVPYPTEDMILLPARTITDVPQAVIDDPRTLLMSLASGRLLARKFVRKEERKKQRTRFVGEVRVYVLDGSSSMVENGSRGARARMRDAILLAEIATLLRRFTDGGLASRVVLYYRYFTKKLGPLTRVASHAEALAAIGDVVGTVRSGGTHIERALLASFDQVRKARDEDPDLASAQIVLITDGDALVREDVVRKAREDIGRLPVGVSVIALGEENPTLRALVARQRARGERAFYHFLSDASLAEICDGLVDRSGALHLPEDMDMAGATRGERAAALKAQLGDLLDELSTRDQLRRVEPFDTGAEDAAAFAELGLLPPALSEGQRAHREVQARDRRALQKRFAVWFPPAVRKQPAPGSSSPEPAAEQQDDIDAVVVALSTVAEVVGELGGSGLSRRADAIELMERLLPDARLSPARYHAVLREHHAEVEAALRAVHEATGMV
jgi:hypothetical protein